MQAITTKFLPTTNHKPSRVKATCQAGNIIMSWDHEFDIDDNHDAIAIALVRKLGWDKECYGKKLVRGGLPKGEGNVYVFCGKASREVIDL